MVFLIILTLIIAAIPTAIFITKKRVALAIITPLSCFAVLIFFQSVFPLVIAGVAWFFVAILIKENNEEAKEAQQMLKEIDQHNSEGSADAVPAPLLTEGEEQPAQENTGEWKCPFCGKLNKSIVRTCECGTKKSELDEL